MQTQTSEVNSKNTHQSFQNLSLMQPMHVKMHDGEMKKISHPYEFMIASFPDYDTFYSYFAELKPVYRIMGSYDEFLQNIYSNIMSYEKVIADMEAGKISFKVNVMMRSLEMFIKMCHRKSMLSDGKVVHH